MTARDFQIKPIEVEGFTDANGVTVNSEGAWLGEIDWQGLKQVVMPYADEDGDYIPAPDDWRDWIIASL